jgi:hypothetical protein
MNTPWTPTTLAAVDDAYDRDRASDGRSRFGIYLRQHAEQLRDCYEPLSAAEFAAAVWNIATEPVMSPGYVRLRPDIHAISPVWSEDGDAALLFDVHVRMPHTALPAVREVPGRWDGWKAGRSLDEPGPYWPQWEPFLPGNALLTTTVVRLLVDDRWALPAPTGRDAALVGDAQASVRAVATTVNELAGPVVAALRGEAS